MKRMLILSAVAAMLFTMSGCRNSWNRTFYRGEPCGTPVAPSCGCGDVYGGVPVSGPAVVQGGVMSGPVVGETMVSPEQALTLPSPGVGAAGSSAPIVTP